MIQYGIADVLRTGLGLRRSTELRSSEFWSLEDINLTVRRGEIVGLCGHNGAGKTTLLKTLSGLLMPDRGSVEICGNVGWLVDIGAGLNPQLTGWENVALRIDMLSMRPLREQLMAYVADFTELGEFLDTPVAFYSAGMKAKLGFAVSTMIEPDVLIIDETLAVGDLAFRMKCYDRIGQISRTAAVLFVSHGMNHVARICNRGIYMEGGKVLYDGDVQQTINLYYDSMMKKHSVESGAFNAELVNVETINGVPPALDVAWPYGGPLSVRMTSKVESPVYYRVVVRDQSGMAVMETSSDLIETPDVTMQFLGLALSPGRYFLSIMVDDVRKNHLAISKSVPLTVAGNVGSAVPYRPQSTWTRHQRHHPHIDNEFPSKDP
jgi:lipopolysaccharide transport system ATP-binding protein